MANNRVQVKRTSVAGRTPNTTNAGNLQYIAAGELALNMTDQVLVTSDGTNLIYVGANQADQRITNTLTLDNNKPIRFKTSNTSAVAYFIQQNDDNFVFYTTNTVYGARPVFSIFANSDTSPFSFGVPVSFTGANVNFNTTRVYANGTSGTAGQVLTSNGTATYWSSAGAASVNVDAQYTWTNTQTFSANISFGNNIGFATAAGIYFNGIADANWRLGRNTGTTTKFFYTGNTIDIIAAGSSLEGIAFGQPGANTYLETGYNGTYTRLPVYIGNSTQNVVATNLTILFQTNTTVNSTHTASLLQIANSTATSNLTATSLNIFANSTVNASLTSTTVSAANSTGNVQAVPTSVTVQNSTVNAVMGLQSVVIQSNTTVNGSITNALVQVANSTGNVQHTATSILAQTNTTVNSTHTASLVQVANSTSTANLVATGLQTYTNSTVNSTVSSSLVQVSNSTSTANLTALDLKIGATTVVNSTQITATLVNANLSGSYANITGQVNTATLYAATSANIASAVQANATGVWTTGTVNAATHAVGTAFTANSTVVNAVSYYSGTLLVANTTVINATHLAGSTWAAPQILGGTTANGASLTYANVSGQVNTATLYATTSANIASIVQANSLGVHVGANVVANTTALKVGNTTLTTTNAVFGGTIAANGGIGTAKQVLTSGGAANASWATLDMTYIPDAAFKKSVRAATTADLAAASATTTTITGTLVALPAQDGITLVVGNRLLVKNQTAAAQNGIYEVTVVGSAGVTAWVLTRTADADTSSEIAGAFVSVDEGTVNGGKVYDNDFKTTDTLGTTAMSWNRNVDDGGATFLGNVVMGTGSTGIYPTSNTVGNALGNTTARWVLVANSGDFSTTLAAGNTTVTGFVNATTTIFAGTSANVGANVQLTTSALTVGNSTVNTTQSSALMQVANSTSTANLTALDLKIGATTVVNSTQVTATLHVGNVSGTYANITGQVNTATLYAATSANVASIVQANSLGVHVGANVVANTTTLKVGNTTITTTNAVFGGTIAANGGIGTAGQVLTSGAAGNVYWSTVASGSVNVDSTYAWTNTHSFAANVSMNGNVGISAPAQNYAKLYVNTAQATDSGLWNTYMYYGDSNGTMTAARTKVGMQSQISNFNQNKSGDGLTTYDAYYYGLLGDAYLGSSSSSQNAYAYEITGGKFTAYQYANGTAANSVNNARGVYGQVWIGSQNSGTVNNAYAAINQIYVPSTTVSGTVNAAYGTFSQIDSNTNVTINNSYLFYGSRRGTVTGNNWGLYISGESNNYISGNTYFNSNVAIGQGAASDTRFRIYGDYGVDFSSYGIFGYFLNTNTALTAARTRYGFQASLPNLSQNKNADGVTLYSTNYRAIVGDAWNGNSSSGGDARANEMIGGNFRVYQYANGTAANTLSTGKGSQNQMFQYGSGVVTSAYGTLSEVVIGNNSVTGNITTAYASRSTIDGNSGPAQIATGYLFYGDYKGTNTATKYGVYITGESNNYFSSNVRIQGASYLVGNVGIGVNAQTDTQLQSSITWTSDAALWNTYLGTVDSNTAMTAARTKHGFQSIMNNVNQNKSADGLTTYAATYRGISSAINNGNTVSGGNAYADEITAARFTTYNYANGTGANTVNLSRGSYVYYGHFGGQTGNVYGHQSFLEIGNSTVTGTITNAVAFNGFIGGNTLGTITTAYLFKGDYSDTNRPTTAWGVYISDESNNYFSNTVYVGANTFVNTSAFFVGNSTVNADMTSSLVQVVNSTSTANLTAADLKIGATTTVNAAQITAPVLSITTNTATIGTTGYFVSNGNVGIGISTPSDLLQVGGTTSVNFSARVDSATASDRPSFRFIHTGGSMTTQSPSASRLGLVSFAGINDASTLSTYSFFDSYLEGAANSIANSNMRFSTVNQGTAGDRIFIAGNTNVGINKSTPVASLDVSGTAVFGDNTSRIVLGSGMLAGNSGIHIDYGVTADTGTIQAETQGTAFRNLAINPSGGNVGIGNTAPDAKLAVTGTANVSANVRIGGTLTLAANVVLGTTTITANGSVGTAGQVLTSGAAGNAYWSTLSVAWSNITGEPTTLSGYGITDGVVRGGGIGSIDYNTERARASGIYSVDAAPTNGPPGAAYSNYLQMTERGDTSAQIVVDYSTGQLHSRGIQTAAPSYSAWKTYISNAANINISGGFTVTAFNLGTGSGTVTPSGLNGNYQYITNNGAFTIAVPGADSAIDILITNGASAGAITFSGYSVGLSLGGTLTTTNGNRFIISIRRVNGVSTYSVYALQ